MRIAGRTIFVVLYHAILTMDFVRGKILCSIHRYQKRAVNRSMILQITKLFEPIKNANKEIEQRAWRNPIQQVANLVVARNLQHTKQGLSVADASRQRHRPLEVQKRRALREEHRECPKGGIHHRVHDIFARPLARQIAQHTAGVFHNLIVSKLLDSRSEWVAHRLWKIGYYFPESYTPVRVGCLPCGSCGYCFGHFHASRSEVPHLELLCSPP